MADVNLPLRAALNDLASRDMLPDPTFDKIEDRKIVEALLDTFLEADISVGRTAESTVPPPVGPRCAVDCHILTNKLTMIEEEPQRARIWIRECLEGGILNMGYDEVWWGDGSQPDDWKNRDRIQVRTMSDLIGWVSWVRSQLPPVHRMNPHRPKYSLPNLQRLCWEHAPVPIEPFSKITLSTAIYELPEKPEHPDYIESWNIWFPRPGRFMAPEAHVEPLRHGTRQRFWTVSEDFIAKIEDKAIELLRGMGKEPATATHKGWGDPPLGSQMPIYDALIEGLHDVIIKTTKAPSHILMHPNMFVAMVKETSSYRGPDTQPPEGLTCMGISVQASPLLPDGTIVYVNEGYEAVQQVSIKDYLPKKRAKLPDA